MRNAEVSGLPRDLNQSVRQSVYDTPTAYVILITSLTSATGFSLIYENGPPIRSHSVSRAGVLAVFVSMISFPRTWNAESHPSVMNTVQYLQYSLRLSEHGTFPH